MVEPLISEHTICFETTITSGKHKYFGRDIYFQNYLGMIKFYRTKTFQITHYFGLDISWKLIWNNQQRVQLSNITFTTVKGTQEYRAIPCKNLELTRLQDKEGVVQKQHIITDIQWAEEHDSFNLGEKHRFFKLSSFFRLLCIPRLYH